MSHFPQSVLLIGSAEIPLEPLGGFAILPAMIPTAVYAKHPDFVQRDVAGECILVPVRRTLKDSNSIYVLNETGAALWHRIDGSRTVRDICAAFIEEYEVTPEQLTQDCDTLLADLLSIQAIHEVAVAHDSTG